MKVYVVIRDYGSYEGYGAPEIVTTTEKLAKEFIDLEVSQRILASKDDYEIFQFDVQGE